MVDEMASSNHYSGAICNCRNWGCGRQQQPEFRNYYDNGGDYAGVLPSRCTNHLLHIVSHNQRRNERC